MEIEAIEEGELRRTMVMPISHKNRGPPHGIQNEFGSSFGGGSLSQESEIVEDLEAPLLGEHLLRDDENNR